MIKIIFTDIDGTLFNKNSVLSFKTINACLKVQAANIPFVINSGRYSSNINNIAKEILVDKYQGYTIGNDGSEIWSFKENKFIYLQQLSTKEVLDLWKWLLKYDSNVILVFSSIMRVYVNKEIPDKFKLLIDQLKLDIFTINDLNEIKEPVSKILAILLTSDKEKMENLRRIFEEKFSDLTIINYADNIYSIGRKDVTKGNAIKWLCDYLKINLADVCAFGDNVNDLSMFEVVGYKMIMGNASEDIKKLGTVILSNDKDGIACFIEDYFKNKIN